MKIAEEIYEVVGSGYGFNGTDEDGIKAVQAILDKQERFKKPTDEQVIDFAILFNNGILDQEKLSDMVAMNQMIIDRLYENGDVTIPTKQENEE